MKTNIITKRIMTFILALSMMLSLIVFPINTHAAENAFPFGHKGDTSGYAMYTNDYFYNNMSPQEKELYDKLYKCCNDLLEGKTSPNHISNQYVSGYYTDPIQFPGYTLKEVEEFVSAFHVSNPQFFFLSTGINGSGNNSYQFKIFDRFSTTAAIAEGKEKMFSVVDSMSKEIEKVSTDYGKIKKAHDMLINHVEYEVDYPHDPSIIIAPDRLGHGQSCYTAFTEGKSVCSGYSQSFVLLMNRAKVPALVITSPEHAYCETQVEGQWYMVDVLWDENCTIYYQWFLRGDESFRYSVDHSMPNNTLHTEREIWRKWNRPTCPKDYFSGNNVEIYNDDKTIATVVDRTLGKSADIPIEITQDGKIYRMYDPNRGEHMYTKNAGEANYLVSIGWQHEENADFGTVDARNENARAVYRLYNPTDGGMHFYTSNPQEAQYLSTIGWNYEGISHYVYWDKSNLGSPQYRLFNPYSTNGQHNWTSDVGERDWLISLGWIDEGVCWRVL